MGRNHAEQEEKFLPSVDWRIVSSLISDWFLDNQRALVFRETRDPYRIMVSEFMLQQTTVAIVVPYYKRFLEKFPDLESLAGANEETVLSHWAGLGYYRRARQLQQAAQVLVKVHGGQFPRDISQIMALPGIGRYTAGAILSCAFDEAQPVLEANTIRVYSRMANIEGFVGEGKFTSKLWKVGERLVETAESPRLLNMGAMELGALVCRPRPDCLHCPVQEHCLAFHFERADSIPVYPPKRDKVIVNQVALVLQNQEGKYLVRRIESGAWHAGMWEFPTFRCESVVEDKLPESVCQSVGDWLSGDLTAAEKLTEIKYVVTHHKISSSVFHCRVKVSRQEVNPPYPEWKWIELAETLDLPMGSAQQKIVKILERNLTDSFL